MPIKLDKTKLVRNLAVKHKLVTHLDRFIEKGEIEWEFSHTAKEKDDAWHPSGDCTPSLLDLYHKATSPATEEKFGAGLRKTFMVGHFWHAYLQHVVVELGFAGADDIERRGIYGWGEITRDNPFSHIPGETLWAPYSWATGSADVCPCVIPSTGEFLVDFKTMGSHDFKRNEAPAWCADKWECQANVYLDWFDLEEAIFVGILKDSPHDMKEFYFRRNQPLIDAIYAKWELVGHCVAEGVEPPADEVIELPLMGPVS